ncbi:MAG TPA: GDCCVxC domain-containing (seleno)protein [Gemmatimonadales bacterium]|nr:GDCCVxC domain-containing (seleno)protein [Gemmatimonadales bacterium]
MPILASTITCPQGGFQKREATPENACVHLYECAGCHKLLRTRAGDCCVFCSYGSVSCPPRQIEAGTA